MKTKELLKELKGQIKVLNEIVGDDIETETIIKHYGFCEWNEKKRVSHEVAIRTILEYLGLKLEILPTKTVAKKK